MNTAWLQLAAAALVGAVLAALACRWWFVRAIAQLHERLAKSEQARQAANERTNQSRTKIEQLSKAIANLQRHHKVAQQASKRRAEALREVALIPEEEPAPPAHGFADTMPLVTSSQS